MWNKITDTIPISFWIRGYSKQKAILDLVAGLTVGLTVLPQALAYSVLAGLEPQFGLYSAFAGCFVYALLGGCRELTIGPTALLALMTARHTNSWAREELAVLLCFLSGVVQAAMAVLRMGVLVDLISLPVTVGFTSATAVIIASSQIKGLFGIRSGKGSGNSFPATIVSIWQGFGSSQVGDSLLGVFSIIILLGLRKLKDVNIPIGAPRWKTILGNILWIVSIGRNALIVLSGALIAYYFENQGLEVPFAVTGSVRSGLPPLKPPPFSASMKQCAQFSLLNASTTQIPDLTNCDNNITSRLFNHTSTTLSLSLYDMIEELGSSILTVPIIAVLGNVAISKAFGGVNLNPSHELLALSMSNIAGSFISSMPVTGSFSRSAVNHASGVQTPLGGIYTGALVLLALCLLTPYFHFIPKASLSAVIICAVIFMIEYEVVRPLWRCSRRELFGCTLTFIVSLAFGVETGLLGGVAWDLLHLVYKAARPDVPVRRITTPSGMEYLLVHPRNTLLYFPAVEWVRAAISQAATEKMTPIVIDCTSLLDVDFTAARGIFDLSRELKDRLILLGVQKRVLKTLEGAYGAKGNVRCALDQDQLLLVIEDIYAQQNKHELKNITAPLLTEESMEDGQT